MKTGIERIYAERERQIRVGWSAAHDDGHKHGEPRRAAQCYALAPAMRVYPKWEDLGAIHNPVARVFDIGLPLLHGKLSNSNERN